MQNQYFLQLSVEKPQISIVFNLENIWSDEKRPRSTRVITPAVSFFFAELGEHILHWDTCKL